MAKSDKKTSSKKPMSEGTAIALVVIGLTAGAVGVYYLLQWIIGLFFPGFIN